MISIIIPVLNEADTIETLLNHLIDFAAIENLSEIIIVDGGSTDNTKNIVNSYISDFTQVKPQNTFIKIIPSERGRAKQMNTGAKIAKGELLYFLHADSFPPLRYDAHIIKEYNKNNTAGCFRLRFDNNHWWLRLAGWLTKFSWRACRGGDQSQFITKALFNDIGGFNESFTIYEDNILINELYRRKQFTVIQQEITTSARLYERHGIWKLQYHFWAIYVKKWFGASPDSLLAYYKKYIA
jgi:rSAM/selenodomain-associated transferase 2